MHRKIGRAQDLATRLTKTLLSQLLTSCKNSILGIGNSVLINLGWEPMRRKSELCGLKFKDTCQAPTGEPTIRLKFSKTDQFSPRKILPISQELFDFLENWRSIISDRGYILRSIRRHRHIGNSRNPECIPTISKTLQGGLPTTSNQQPLSGHLFSVDAALDPLEQGVPYETIMLRGGWQTDSTAMKYLRNWGCNN